MLLAERCCIPNTDFGILMCSDDAIKLSGQLDKAIENDEFTEEHRETLIGGFNILIPEGYYALRNSKMGNFDLPLYLLAYGEDQETPLIFNTIYFEAAEGSIYDTYDSFYDGMLRSMSLHSVDTEITGPLFFESDQGIEFFTLNMTKSINGEEEKTSIGLVSKGESNLVIFFTSYEPYFSTYYYEFENMMHSIE